MNNNPRTNAPWRVLIIGSGFAGLGLAMQLRKAGEDDFLLLEKAGEVGGTWRDNSYPGAACDVPSHLYPFPSSLSTIGRASSRRRRKSTPTSCNAWGNTGYVRTFA